MDLKISVLDISNAWVFLYTLNNHMDVMLKELAKAATDDTRLLTSRGYNVPYWLYAGFTFGFVRASLASPQFSFPGNLDAIYSGMERRIRHWEDPFYRESILKVQSPLFNHEVVEPSCDIPFTKESASK